MHWKLLHLWFLCLYRHQTALLDCLCSFKLMLRDLSRCSKSPEMVVFNKRLSVELGHGVIVKVPLLTTKRRLTVAVSCEALQRQASPDPVNYVQQLNKTGRTMMKAASLLLCSAEPICFALGLTEGAPCAHWDPEASHVTSH